MLDKFYEICKFIVCLCGTILIVLFTVASIYIVLKQGDKRKMKRLTNAEKAELHKKLDKTKSEFEKKQNAYAIKQYVSEQKPTTYQSERPS